MQEQTIRSHIIPPKMFRRDSGTHAIIAELLIADIAGLTLAILIGAAAGQPTWWLLRAITLRAHDSFVLDSTIMLLLLCLIIGLVRQTAFQIEPGKAWGGIIIMISCLVTIYLMLFLLHNPLLSIPAPGLPL